MFKVAPWEFYLGNGYTFPDVINPVSANETYWGQELGETGDPTNWSGQTFKLDPNAGLKSVLAYLVSDPQPVEFPTGQEIWDTAVRLTSALWKSWYPFVPQSTLWNPSMSLSAYLWRPFAKVLCPDCNPADPFMPVDWKPGDDIPAGSYVPLKYKKDYDENGHWIGPDPATESTTTLLAANASTTPTDDTADAKKPAAKSGFLADAVQTLTEKFQTARSEKEAARAAADAKDTTDTSAGSTAAEKPAKETSDDSVTKPVVEAPAEATPAETTKSDAKATDDGTSTQKKWTFGGKHHKSDDSAQSSDTSSGAAADKPSESKKRTSGSSGSKTKAGAASNSSGGSDSGGSK
jgi:hypothetical protein